MVSEIPPINPFGQFPEEWRHLISEIRHSGGDANGREGAKARLEAEMLVVDLQHRERMASRAERQAELDRGAADRQAAAQRSLVEAQNALVAAQNALTASLNKATWVLVILTLGLLVTAVAALFTGS
jgi:hypothetical protein